MIYCIETDYSKYLDLSIDYEEILFEIEEAMGEDAFLDFSYNNSSLSKYWRDFGGHFNDTGACKNPSKPDVTNWHDATLFLSHKAHDVLSGALKPFGEFLPISIDGESCYIFNCMNVVDVDEENSVADIADGAWLGVKSVVFKEGADRGNLVFKTKFDRCVKIYCGDEFKALIEGNGLGGVDFIAL